MADHAIYIHQGRESDMCTGVAEFGNYRASVIGWGTTLGGTMTCDTATRGFKATRMGVTVGTYHLRTVAAIIGAALVALTDSNGRVISVIIGSRVAGLADTTRSCRISAFDGLVITLGMVYCIIRCGSRNVFVHISADESEVVTGD